VPPPYQPTYRGPAAHGGCDVLGGRGCSSIPPAPWDGGAINGELHPQQQIGDTYEEERTAGS